MDKNFARGAGVSTANITFKPGGDIFKSTARFLVNPVNCVGMSGALAGAFADRYPEMAATYESLCNSTGTGVIQMGCPIVYDFDPTGVGIILFPTMVFPGSPASLGAIVDGLLAVRKTIQRWGIKSMAFPMIGCGVGGLRWEWVRNCIIMLLGDLDVTLELYGPELGAAKSGAPVQADDWEIPLEADDWEIPLEAARRARKGVVARDTE